MLDIGNNRQRAIPSMLLAIHVLCQPVDERESVIRDDCLSLGKFKEEGTLSEVPTILGWVINTRALAIALPQRKTKYWLEELRGVISAKKISYKKLKTIVGRLNHAAAACPLFWYFLNRTRNTLTHWEKSYKSKKYERYLSRSVLSNLKLWHDSFSPKISQGMSLNLILFH
jgi:hypothetical protein